MTYKKFGLIPGGKKEPEKEAPRRFALTYLIPIILLLLLAVRILLPMVGFTIGSQVKTVTLAGGTIEKTLQFPVVIWRDEQVIFAGQGGYIVWCSDEGSRVSTKGKILEMSNILPSGIEEKQQEELSLLDKIKNWIGDDGELPPETEINQWEVEVPEPGWISFYLDGYEGQTWQELLSLLQEDTAVNLLVNEPGNYIKNGEPLYKLVRDHRWIIAASLDLEKGEKLIDRDNSLPVLLGIDTEQPLKVRLVSFQEEGGRYIIAWEIDRELEGYTLQRITDAEVVYEQVYGYKLPQEAVFEQDGATGVYRVKDGLACFIPVTVTDSFNGEVLVEGISPPAMIVINPQAAKEGERIQ